MIKAVTLLAAFLVIAGCIAVPVGGGEDELIVEDRIKFIERGKSTKSQIEESMNRFLSDLGYPRLDPVEFDGGKRWLYSQRRGEAKWFVAGAAFGQAGAGASNTSDFRFLLLEFDEFDKLMDYEFSSAEGRGCNRKGICVYDVFALIGSTESELQAKQYVAHENTCNLYLYDDRRYRRFFTVDGQFSGIFGGNFFYYWQLTPGQHKIAAGAAEPMAFRCFAGDLIFFEVVMKRLRGDTDGRKFLVQIIRRDMADGIEAVGKRKLAYSYSTAPN